MMRYWFNSIRNRMKKTPRQYLCLRMLSAIMMLSRMKLHASKIWLEGYLLATYLILAQLRYRLTAHNCKGRLVIGACSFIFAASKHAWWNYLDHEYCLFLFGFHLFCINVLIRIIKITWLWMLLNSGSKLSFTNRKKKRFLYVKVNIFFLIFCIFGYRFFEGLSSHFPRRLWVGSPYFLLSNIV